MVCATSGGDVLHSVINGQVVMRDRRLLSLDEEDILASMRTTAAHLASL